jgi:ribosomal protein S18 acetylase RimI-like enzyme
MKVARTNEADIQILESWFPDAATSYFWGGPGLRYPFTHQSFMEDIHWEKMPSWSLQDEAGNFLGFGQYYEKAGRCHLARLVISPELRGKGQGQWFIGQLMNIGMKELDLGACSLFVLKNNASALRCYSSLGFVHAPYPPEHKIFDDIDFMVNPA